MDELTAEIRELADLHGHDLIYRDMATVEVHDIIIGQKKREMGEDWRGCTMVETATLTNWYAVVIVNEAKRVVDAPTESAAVLAAYRAWKEATNG